MNILIVESVFNTPALYCKETNIVTLNGKECSFEEFDTENLVLRIYEQDEYHFLTDLTDQLYDEHLYTKGMEEFYNPSPEYYF